MDRFVASLLPRVGFGDRKPIARSFLLTLVAGLLLCATPSWSTGSDRAAQKAPQEWTTAERLEMRLSPERILDRNLASPAGSGVPSGGYVIDGRFDPELFLPWELFNQLLAIAFSEDPSAQEIFREAIERNLRPVELPPSFWEDLRLQASDELDSIDAQRERAKALAGATASEARAIENDLADLQAHGCQRRFRALRAAEKHFGRDFFHQVLYQGVAPETTITVPSTDGEEIRLRLVEGGCNA